MPIAEYSSDLQDITTAESNAGWSELSGHSSGGADATEETQYIHGAACVSQSTGVATGQAAGMEYDYGSDMSASMLVGFCFFVWQNFLAPVAVDTWANGGMRFGVGSSSGNMNFWNTIGNDFGKFPYGGWQNNAVDPTFAPDGIVDGAPTGAYQIFGSNPNILSAVSKGNPHAVDAIRYGRGEIKVEFGDPANGYAIFSAIADLNDTQTNRWGLFQKEGTGNLWKGLISFGNATNACDFRDSNVNITVDDTPRTYAAFNKMEVRNANSNLEWSAVAIEALNPLQLSRGGFEIIDDGAVVKHTSCTFTSLDSYKYGSNATVINTTHRGCEPVYQLLGTMTDGTIDTPNNTVGMYIDNLTAVTGYTFNSKGTGYAVDLGTFSSNTSISWDNKDYGFAATDGSTGNETISVSVDSGITLTINVAGGGATVPTIHNTGLGTVTVVSGQVTLSISGHPVGATVLVYDLDSGNTEDLGTELARFDSAASTVQYQYSGGKAGDDVQIKMIEGGYKIYSQPHILGGADAPYAINSEQETN